MIFSLNVGGEPGTLSHLGIRYPTTGDVASEMVRVKQSEVSLFQQQGTTCRYAKADKFWVRDSDGIPWEMYIQGLRLLLLATRRCKRRRVRCVKTLSDVACGGRSDRAPLKRGRCSDR